MLEKILTYIFKGIIYSLILGVIGGVFSLLKGWNILKGSYIFILTAGVITMILSVALLIGTPQMRKAFFFAEEYKNNPDRGREGIGPALMGIVMMIIGLIVEAITH